MDDYVDVYTQVRISDIDDLLSVPLHGRYCGSDEQKLPKRLISMTNVLVLGFYTVSSKETDTESKRKGFRAHYSFIGDCKSLSVKRQYSIRHSVFLHRVQGGAVRVRVRVSLGLKFRVRAMRGMLQRLRRQ